jgi:hypothetical protein
MAALTNSQIRLEQIQDLFGETRSFRHHSPQFALYLPTRRAVTAAALFECLTLSGVRWRSTAVFKEPIDEKTHQV